MLVRGGRAARGAVLIGAIGAAAGIAGACGGRTGLSSPPPAPPAQECTADADCKGSANLCKPVFCQLPEGDGGGRQEGGGAAAGEKGVCVEGEPIDCDDNDPCTSEACEPATGDCHYAPATLDSDGDGHRAPLPGTIPGGPGSCGDDCDDTSAAALPGGVEVCDGVDNDCDGTVDNGATFIPLGADVRISGDVAPAGTAGLAWSGTSYAAVYSGQVGNLSILRSMLSQDGQVIPPGEGVLTPANGDAGGGALVWVGDRYGLAWSDRRTGDYEVYFSLLDVNGNKVNGGDKQLSFAPEFSINVSLAWNGSEFLPVWQDLRDGIFNIYAQRIDVDGNPVGSNVALTDGSSGFEHQGPSVAAGSQGVGVAWTSIAGSTHVIELRTFAADLTPVSSIVTLTDGITDAEFPTVVWNKDRYVVAWFDKTAFPAAIYAAAVSEQGDVITAPKAITNPGSFRSRYPNLRPLGDRLLVVYADDRDLGDYEIYSEMVSAELTPIGPEQRLTFAGGNSTYPIAAFGPGGDVGILFRDHRLGEDHVFFTRLGCVTATP